MLKQYVINQIIIPVLVLVIGTILEMARRDLKAFLAKKASFIEKQEEALKQKIGEEQYKKDVDTAKKLIKSVEQQAREFDWEGTIKHAKATELITQQTGLSAEDIFHIIKATVAEMNTGKPKKVVAADPPVETVYEAANTSVTAELITGTIAPTQQ